MRIVVLDGFTLNPETSLGMALEPWGRWKFMIEPRKRLFCNALKMLNWCLQTRHR